MPGRSSVVRGAPAAFAGRPWPASGVGWGVLAANVVDIGHSMVVSRYMGHMDRNAGVTLG